MALHIAYISVGSNLGKRIQNCQKGISSLGNATGTTVVAQSPFYETEPVDCKDQDWFVNGVIKIETELAPHSLLATLKDVEKKLGRRRQPIRFGPRVIDLDIILYDELAIDTPELEIPHPRMHQRRFVLKPICDIDPNLRHPSLHQTMIELYDAINGQEQDMKVIALE
jgi:2-amino-4-hydroxy-6-hydroxymethyldihydropteridine diphosphokinase